MLLKKKILFSLLGFVLIGTLVFPFLSQAAGLELRYPKIPGVAHAPTSKSTLPEYLAYLYYFAVDIVGILAFVILVAGGVKYLTAAGSVTRVKAARKQLIGGATGLLIVLGAFITLRTINPQLVGIQSTPPIPLHGVCLYANRGDNDEEMHCLSTNTPKILPEDFQAQEIEFEGPAHEFSQVFLFPDDNYQGAFEVKKNRRRNMDDAPPTEVLGVQPHSIYFDDHGEGIFLFAQEGGDYSQETFDDFPNNLPVVLNSSINDLENFNDRTKSLLFRYSYEDWRSNFGLMNSSVASARYPDHLFGAILHTETDGMGECGIIWRAGITSASSTDLFFDIPSTNIDNLPGFGTLPGSGSNDSNLPGFGTGTFSYASRQVPTLNDIDIHPITRVRSAHIFDREFRKDIQGSVTFYSELDYGGESYTVPASEIQDNGYFWQTTFDSYPWHGLDRILSIQVEGSFWVVLTNKKDFANKCQVFSTSTKDLKSTYVLSGTPVNRPQVFSIAIIPIRPSAE